MSVRTVRSEGMRLGVGLTGAVVFSWMVALGWTSDAWAGSLRVEAEVLEASDEIELPGQNAATIRYAVVHHARAEDQPVFARWLQAHQHARIRFAARGAGTYQAELHRLKHCFGRGLLVYSGSVSLSEKEVIVLSLDSARHEGK